MIIAIIPNSTEKDSWYWKYEKLGNYSVKSAYIQLHKNKESVHSSDNSGFWRKLWNLKIPAKAKNLLWRAVTGCLPCKVQLKSKNVAVNDLCPMCNEYAESTVHILVSCSFAVACWSSIGISTGGHNLTSFGDRLISMFDKYGNNEISMAVVLLWSIWRCRNEVVWNQKGMETREDVESAKLSLKQWQNAQDKYFDFTIGLMKYVDGAEHWRKPEDNKIKVNVDAVVFNSSNLYSYSMVAGNQYGELIEAKAWCTRGNITPHIAEAISIREALSWIKANEWRNVILESDCLVVVQAIRTSTALLSYFGRVISECKNLMENQGVVLNFVTRSANQVVHLLANSTNSLADRSLSVSNAHIELINVLNYDLKF